MLWFGNHLLLQHQAFLPVSPVVPSVPGSHSKPEPRQPPIHQEAIGRDPHPEGQSILEPRAAQPRTKITSWKDRRMDPEMQVAEVTTAQSA